MLYHHNFHRYLVRGFISALLTGIMLLGFTQWVIAAERSGHRESRDSGYHHDLNKPAARGHSAEVRSGAGPREFKDARYRHDHNYPVRGHSVAVLPGGHRVVMHGKSRYYFQGGVWYRPEGRHFVVFAPPFGLIVPFLPLYYTTLWIGGIPYYYANEVYYTQTTGGYMVVEPPKGDVQQAPPAEGQLFIYPRNNQSEQQQATDRYECHRWSVSQTGYDPTQPAGSVPEVQTNQKRADYKRAMSACLDARGYTVK